MADNVRIDKWVWAVRIYKTRSLATEACKKGHISIGALPVKPSKIVHPGDIVKWKKADDSNIKEIKLIRIKEVYGTGFSDEDRIIKGLYELEIPLGTKPGIMIYEIEFIVHGDPTIHTIDPYLRIPDD